MSYVKGSTSMKIGIIGSGNIGGTLARLLVRDGHDVAISNSRGPDTLADMVRELGPKAHAATVAEAAEWGDIVIEAIPFGRYRDLPVQELMGKTVISASNYYPQRDGKIARDGRATVELVAEHLAGARVVKAFNTIYFEHLARQGDTGKPMDDRRVIPISGDDADAKQEVAALVTALGFAPLDMGSLHDSTQQEPDAPIYNVDLTFREARELLGR
jgi:8-hydroxy-5-deazaflavin:NADPH oxidoreductase